MDRCVHFQGQGTGGAAALTTRGPHERGATLTGEVDEEVTMAGEAAVLPEVDPLPAAQAEGAVEERNRQRGGGERRLDVSGHVVRSFLGVGIERIALRYQPVEPALEVAPCRGIGVLLDHQAPRGV